MRKIPCGNVDAKEIHHTNKEIKIFLLLFVQKIRFQFLCEAIFFGPFSYFLPVKDYGEMIFIHDQKHEMMINIEMKIFIVTKRKRRNIKVHTFRWRGSVQVKNDRLKNSNKNLPTLDDDNDYDGDEKRSRDVGSSAQNIYPQRKAVMSHKLFERKP